MKVSNILATNVDLADIKHLCRLRDERYTTTFYGEPFFKIISPIIDSILQNGGIPCFIGEGANPLPESTATCLLALYRLRIINEQTVQQIQNYLLGTNTELARILSSYHDSFDPNVISIEDCAWNVSEGRNVWSTSQVLWALIATRYDGIYKPILLASVRWLLKQQYPEGGWAFVAERKNKPNVFVTSLTLYTLKLSLRLPEWKEVERREIQEAIVKGCDYLIKSRSPGRSYWTSDLSSNDTSIEPTSTAMALWALHHCSPKQPGIRDIITDGVMALKRDLGKKDVWDSQIIVDGYISETGKQKTLYGFTPSLPLILLQLGVSPTDEAIIKPINLLLKIKRTTGWEFFSTKKQPKSASGYYDPRVHYVGSGDTMTFTTALAIWTIEEWHKQLLRHSVGAQIGNIQSKLTETRQFVKVRRSQLALILVICGISVISMYFIILGSIFDQPISKIISELTIRDISDALDSLVKLLFFPLAFCLLLIHFFFYGDISLEPIKSLWRRIFW